MSGKRSVAEFVKGKYRGFRLFGLDLTIPAWKLEQDARSRKPNAPRPQKRGNR